MLHLDIKVDEAMESLVKTLSHAEILDDFEECLHRVRVSDGLSRTAAEAVMGILRCEILRRFAMSGPG